MALTICPHPLIGSFKRCFPFVLYSRFVPRANRFRTQLEQNTNPLISLAKLAEMIVNNSGGCEVSRNKHAVFEAHHAIHVTSQLEIVRGDQRPDPLLMDHVAQCFKHLL